MDIELPYLVDDRSVVCGVEYYAYNRPGIIIAVHVGVPHEVATAFRSSLITATKTNNPADQSRQDKCKIVALHQRGEKCNTEHNRACRQNCLSIQS